MKKFGLFMFVLLLVVSSAMAVVLPAPEGTTHQCWDFNQQPLSNYFVLPNQESLDNQFGDPIGMINDLSVQKDMNWGNGTLYGSEFKIILDIPNQPIDNPYKLLTISMKYQGDISLLWVLDVDTGNKFTPVDVPSIQVQDGWNIFSQQWRFEPNPREELVVIGFKGTQEVTGAPIMAALDQICIDTICVPEPATMTLLVLGAGCVLRRKR